MADQVAVFSEGRVAQIGSPADIYERPATRFVADFVGSSNVLPPALTRAFGGPESWASLRPEALSLTGAEGAAVTGRVTALRYLGAGTRVALESHGQELAVLAPAGTSLPQPGETVGLRWDARALHVMAGA